MLRLKKIQFYLTVFACILIYDVYCIEQCLKGYFLYNNSMQDQNLEPLNHKKLISSEPQNYFQIQWDFKQEESVDFMIIYSAVETFNLIFNEKSNFQIQSIMFQINFQNENLMSTQEFLINQGKQITEVETSSIKILGFNINLSKQKITIKFNKKQQFYHKILKNEFYQWSYSFSQQNSSRCEIMKDDQKLQDDIKIQLQNLKYFDIFLSSTNQLSIGYPCFQGEVFINNSCTINDILPLSQSIVLQDNNITLEWQFNSDGQTIDFLITYNFISWFGLGFNSQMTNTSMAIIEIVNTSVLQISDMYASGHTVINLKFHYQILKKKPQQNIPQAQGIVLLGYNISLNPNQTIVKFRRNLIPAQSPSPQQSIQINQFFQWIYAFSDSYSLKFHGLTKFRFQIYTQNASINPCPEGQVLINNKCTINDIAPLKQSLVLQQNNISLQWQFSSDGQTIDFIIKYKFISWFGFGFNNIMTNTNMAITQIVNISVLEISDRYSQAHKPPPLNIPPTQGIILLGYNISFYPFNQTIVKFRRLLVPLDSPNPQQTIQLNQPYIWIYAFSNNFSLNYHQTSKSSFQIYTTNSTGNPCPDGQVLINNTCVDNDLSPLSQSLVLLENNVTLFWQFNNDNLTIDFIIQYQFISWFGLGFNVNMTQTDMAIIQIVNTSVLEISDRYSQGHQPPPLNIPPTQGIILLGYSITFNPNQTIVKFRRNLIPTASVNPQQSIALNQFYYWIFAFSNNFSMNFHSANHYSYLIYTQNQSSSPCPQGQVLIDNICVKNDLKPLSQSLILQPNNITLYWQFTSDGKFIDFLIQYGFISWFGMGFNSSMIYCDMAIIQIINTSVLTLEDHYSKNHTKPPLNVPPTQGLQLLGYNISVNPFQTVVKYRRLLQPLDSPDPQQSIVLNQNYTWIYAFSPAFSLSFHNSNNYHYQIQTTNISGNPCPQGEVLIDGVCVQNNISPLSSSQVLIDNNVTLQWQFNDDGQTIDFLIQYQFLSWFGLGFNQNMTNTDMAIIQIENTSVLNISDRYSFGHSPPQLNIPPTQGIKLLGYSISLNPNQTIVKFRRFTVPLQSKNPQQSILQNQIYTWIFAFNNNYTLSYHGLTRFIFQISTKLNPVCPTGQVLINDVCVQNNIIPLNNSIVLQSNNITLQWAFNSDNSTIDFIITYKFLSWFGLGFGPQMTNTSMAIIQIKNTSVLNLTDEYATGHQMPTPQIPPVQGLQLLGYFINYNPNVTIVKFRRKLVPDNNTYPQQSIVVNQTYSWIFAYSPTYEISYHNQTKSQFQITVYSTPICPAGQVIVDGLCQNNIAAPISDVTINGGQVKVFWQFMNTTTFSTQNGLSQQAFYLDMMVTYQWNSWFGLGFNNVMTNTNMVIIQMNGNEVTLTDMYAIGHSRPQPQMPPTQGVVLLGYQVQENQVTVKFRRNLVPLANGKVQQSLTGDQNYVWCYAYSMNPQMQFHGVNSYTFGVYLSTDPNGYHQNANVQNKTLEINIHRAVLFWGWGVFIDVAIIFARYFKTFRFYSEFHGAMAFLLIGSTVVLEILVIRPQKPPNSVIYTHFIMGLIFFGLMAGQLFLGIYSKFLILSKKDNLKRMIKIKKAHKWFGMLIYLYAKVQICLGKYTIASISLTDTKESVLEGVLLVSIVFFVRIIIELIYKFPPQFIINLFKVENQDDEEEEENQELLNKDLDLVHLLNTSQQENIEKIEPQPKYCILGNTIINTSKIMHPGGHYIFEKIQGREIDRFVFGGYALESSEIAPRNHSWSAFQLMQRNQIGLLNNVPNSYLLISDEQAVCYEKLFQIKFFQALSKNITIYYLSSYNLKIREYLKGVRWFGRYFQIRAIIEDDSGSRVLKQKKRLYTSVLSMSSLSQIRRKKFLLGFESEFNQSSMVLKEQSIELNNTLDCLPLIIKNYNTQDAFSQFIFKSKDNKFQQYEISGPNGLGLQLTSQTEGLFIIFAGGTGILPFLDFFDFLLKKSVYEASKQINQQLTQKVTEFLEDDFEKQLVNFKVKFYGTFPTKEDFIGEDIIDYLYRINKLYKLDIFDCEIKINSFVQNNSKSEQSLVSQKPQNIDFSEINLVDDQNQQTINKRFSDQYNQRFSVSSYPIISSRFDKKFILSKKNDWGSELKKIFICGPPAMNKDLPVAIIENGIDEKCIHLI